MGFPTRHQQGVAVADAAASSGAEEGDGDESAGGIGAELEAGDIFMGMMEGGLKLNMGV